MERSGEQGRNGWNIRLYIHLRGVANYVQEVQQFGNTGRQEKLRGGVNCVHGHSTSRNDSASQYNKFRAGMVQHFQQPVLEVLRDGATGTMISTSPL